SHFCDKLIFVTPISKMSETLEISGFARLPIIKWVHIPLMLLQENHRPCWDYVSLLTQKLSG
ncbi:hypothetical protein, partial [Staphylococcus pseudintermedius]|uniref:hypothetical protein n=1 Tax=Staphylococcus pseudintermedius TaxID=283734 RepID=UPI0036F3810F